MVSLESMLAVVGLIVAGIVKGVTGLGYASCALPFLVTTVGLEAGMAIVIGPALATNISLALGVGQIRDTMLRFRGLYLSMVPGIAAGVGLLTLLAQHLAVRLLGLVIVAYVLLALLRPELRVPQRYATPLQWPTGFLNGVVTGLTGAQVMPLFPYVMGLHLEPARTVQVINLAVLIGSTFLAAGLLVSGIMTSGLLALSCLAIVPALVGVGIGNKARSHLPAANFRRVALITLLCLGFLMLVR
jgi:uncharacterized protein